jgi:4-hydroxy-L-threonine phosphate dehydrogenase PdxA
MSDSLKRDFAVDRPKIAVLSLNPHNGDHGLLGKEEEEIIKPAIQEFLKRESLFLARMLQMDSLLLTMPEDLMPCLQCITIRALYHLNHSLMSRV